MLAFIQEPFRIGTLKFPHRLIQGPLAGFSSAPFRALFYQFLPPAYSVSEMISAHDVLFKHQIGSRYLYRAPNETKLCYQLAGYDRITIADAAIKLEAIGADLIDLNCGCPKPKIRKKGAGSALLEDPKRLCDIVSHVRRAIQVPLTVKLRIYGNEADLDLAKAIENAGADALIVHGRRWTEDYDIPSDYQQIRAIKNTVRIPVIANGDISDEHTLAKAISSSACDAYMISRKGVGHPWIYQQLLGGSPLVNDKVRVECFLSHLEELSHLIGEHQAVLQSKTLVRYYFKNRMSQGHLQDFYDFSHLDEVRAFIKSYYSL